VIGHVRRSPLTLLQATAMKRLLLTFTFLGLVGWFVPAEALVF
jgi:hypothetical protein